MPVEIITKDELKEAEARLNRKIRFMRNNMGYLPEPNGPWLMGVKQMIFKLGISREQIMKMIKTGELKPIHLVPIKGAKMYFKVNDVLELIQMQDELSTNGDSGIRELRGNEAL